MQTIEGHGAETTALEWPAQVSLQLAEGVRLLNVTKNRWQLAFGSTSISFVLPGALLPSVFSKLSQKGLEMSEVVQFAAEAEGELSVIEQLRRLCRAGVLVQALSGDGTSLAVMRGTGAAVLESMSLHPWECMTLDEGACIRKERAHMIIESTACGAQIELVDPRLFLVPAILIGSHSLSDVVRSTGLPSEWVDTLVAWLFNIGAVHIADGLPEQGSSHWSFADRLFHARSRKGRHLGGYGSTFPLRGKIADPLACAAGRGGPRILLSRPDLNVLMEKDPPFTAVFERRRSLRNHSSVPLTAEELGHFLFRAARIRDCIRGEAYEFTSRPYPSGGALYELELYVLVNQCAGLEPSLYWYDVQTHSLELVSIPTPETDELSRAAGRSAGTENIPQVLIVLSARFGRVFWKYESMGYALILKNVGALYQSLYLVATAMGLAPCALGGGDSQVFCRAAGKSFWEESSVGEFILGRPE